MARNPRDLNQDQLLQLVEDLTNIANALASELRDIWPDSPALEALAYFEAEQRLANFKSAADSSSHAVG